MPDSLASETVAPRLRGRFGRDYTYVPECPSTQRLLPTDAGEGALAVTDHQTEGRGRLGRSWEDRPGASLLCSLALRPQRAPRALLPELSPLAAEACAEAIATVTSLAPEVKQPNDVLVRDRKVAGILGEASGSRVVLGIGINVNQRRHELPDDVRLPATSLRVETGATVDRVELLVTLLEVLERRYDAWLATAAARAG